MRILILGEGPTDLGRIGPPGTLEQEGVLPILVRKLIGAVAPKMPVEVGTHEPQTEAEVKRVRESLRRGRPFGSLSWMNQTAHRLGLEATMRPIGRPRKPQPKLQSLIEDDSVPEDTE